MKFKYKILVVSDDHGNKDVAVVEDMQDVVQICRLVSNDGKPLSFESDAYHLERWCETNGFDLELIEKEENV